MDDIYCDIEIFNWPKRRRAILYLLDNPRSGGLVMILADNLARLLDANGHPMCAYAVRLRMSGMRVRMAGSEIIVVEDIAALAD